MHPSWGSRQFNQIEMVTMRGKTQLEGVEDNQADLTTIAMLMELCQELETPKKRSTKEIETKTWSRENYPDYTSLEVAESSKRVYQSTFNHESFGAS